MGSQGMQPPHLCSHLGGVDPSLLSPLNASLYPLAFSFNILSFPLMMKLKKEKKNPVKHITYTCIKKKKKSFQDKVVPVKSQKQVLGYLEFLLSDQLWQNV